MRLLLDTHIWLWSLLAPENLSRRVANELASPANELWLCPLSVWETLLFAERRRLVLEPDPDAWVVRALKEAPVREAPLTHEVALESRRVTLPHRDPVDRFLAATARVYDLVLVTADARLLRCRGLAHLANKR